MTAQNTVQNTAQRAGQNTAQSVGQKFGQAIPGQMESGNGADISAVNPSVSWLLCTNSSGPLLRRAIDSCLAQTLTDFELLLVVNGADAEVIRQELTQRYQADERVRVVATPLRGLNFSLSLGLHLAKAPLVARMDADDVADKTRLQRQFQRMQENPSLVVLGSAYKSVDADNVVHGIVAYPCSDAAIRRRMLFHNPFCHPAVMLRKEAVLAAGGYLGGEHAEDYDLWARLALNPSCQFENLAEPLLGYNLDPSGAARASRRAYANMAAAQLRNFLLGAGWRWLLGACITGLKAIFLAKKA